MNQLSARFNQLWDKLVFYLQASVIGRFLLWAAHVIQCLIDRSLLVRIMASERIYDMAENSLLARILGGIFRLMQRFGHKIGRPMVRRSLLFRSIGRIKMALRYITFRAMGVFLIPVVLGIMVGLRLPILWTLCTVAAIAVIFLPLQQSVYAAVVNSWTFRILTDMQDDNNYTASKRNQQLQQRWALILGIFCLVVDIILGPLAMVGLIALVAGASVLLYRPEIGIFACVFFAPFLPTMVLAGMLGVTLMCFVLSVLGGSRRYTFKIDTTGLFLIAFGVILLFFGFTSFDRATSIKIALLECLFLCAYFLILLLVDNRLKIKCLVFTYCFSSLLTGFVGLWQYFSGHVDTTWTDTELFEDLQLRVYSTFENPNVYGEYLLLCLPMAVVMIFLARRPIMKAFYALTSVVLLANLALTYSRGCYLAIILAVAVVIWFGERRLVALGFVGLFALPFVLPQSIIQRFASITNFSDSSTSYRISIWQGTIRMLMDYWPFGVGLGQQAYNTVYPLYGLNAIYAPHAHSLYLQVLSEMGIAGFVLLAGFCLAFLSACYVAYRKAKGSKTMWFVIAMMAGVIAFLFEGIFEYIWYNYRVFLLFFITMGITSALCRRVIREGELTFD